MADEYVELESIHNLKEEKQTLVADYFRRLISGTSLLSVNLLRKRQKVQLCDVR